MKKFIIIPDSFKGTLSSFEVCDIVEREIKAVFSQATTTKIPVADGGEGSVDAFLTATPGKKIIVNVTGPYFETVEAFYGIIDEGKTAVIEMAAAAGLPLVKTKNPARTTTYGFGELILDAIKQGVTKIILGLGGSATNDGGCGFAAALGVKFIDVKGEPFIPVGGTLDKIEHIDMSSIHPAIKTIDFVTMCDIDNPLYGKEGAAHIFGPQKGADADMVNQLDDNLKHFAKVVKEDLSFEDVNFLGAGAAGGMGFGTKVFLDSKIQMGIETVLDAIDFNHLAKEADYIITGEGKLDAQSLRGKVVIGVAQRAKKTHSKVIAVVGSIDGDKQTFYQKGIDDIVVTNYLNLSFEAVIPRAKEDLQFAVRSYLEKLKNNT